MSERDLHDVNARFERALLESARDDAAAPGPDVDAAWQRFAASLNALGASTSESDGAASALQTGAPELPALAQARRLHAAKWTLIGAAFGSALTVLTVLALRGDRLTAPATPAAVQPGAVHVSPARSEPTDATSAAAQPATSAGPPAQSQLAPAAAPPAGASAAALPTRVPAVTNRARAANAESALRAQVALLDAARKHAAAGDHRAALRVVERFEREFPHGQLAPDAQVVAIQALAAQGDRDQLTIRAARFLAAHPLDPHAAQVRHLSAAP